MLWTSSLILPSVLHRVFLLIATWSIIFKPCVFDAGPSSRQVILSRSACKRRHVVSAVMVKAKAVV